MSLNRVLTLALYSAAIACYVGLTTGGAVAKSQKLGGTQLSQYLVAMKELVEAGDQVHANMEVVANRVHSYVNRKGHFPRTPQEKEAFCRSLVRFLKPNPYKPQKVDELSSPEKVADHSIRIDFVEDNGVSFQLARSAIKDPPSNWRAEPGSITVVHNSYDYFLVWAAGPDWNPVRNMKTNNNVKIIARYIGEQM